MGCRWLACRPWQDRETTRRMTALGKVSSEKQTLQVVENLENGAKGKETLEPVAMSCEAGALTN